MIAVSGVALAFWHSLKPFHFRRPALTVLHWSHPCSTKARLQQQQHLLTRYFPDEFEINVAANYSAIRFSIKAAAANTSFILTGLSMPPRETAPLWLPALIKTLSSIFDLLKFKNITTSTTVWIRQPLKQLQFLCNESMPGSISERWLFKLFPVLSRATYTEMFLFCTELSAVIYLWWFPLW